MIWRMGGGKNNSECFREGGERNHQGLGEIDIDGWRRRKATGEKKNSLSRSQHGKDSRYIGCPSCKGS